MRAAVVGAANTSVRTSGSPSSAPIALEIDEVTKTYPGGTRALKGVSLQLRPGQVHGLVGANGAGKSTLIKIIAGAERPSSGELRWQGTTVDWRRPADAQAAGVAVVHQQSPVSPALSVLENVYLGAGAGALWNPNRRQADFAELCASIGFSIDPHAVVASLSIGDRQMVSILRALARRPQLMLLDEPTASITPAERAGVLGAARQLALTGVAVVFVSHFLNEVTEICDVVSVLRDGKLVDSFGAEELTEERMVTGIIGNRLRAVESTHVAQQPGDPVLELRRLRSTSMAAPVDLTVRSGEIVGLAGLLGSGRTELLKAVFGADRRTEGEVLVEGKPLSGGPAAAVKRGVAFVPEDRLAQGLIGDWEIWRNVSMADLGSLSRRFLRLDPAAERARAAQACAELGVVAASIDTPVRDLSGGNAQKVVFAKWIYKTHAVLLLDEPTAGVDVGGKADLIMLIRALAARGMGIVVVLSEFEELLSVADRVVVLNRGAVTAGYRSDEVSVAELTAAAGGLS
ncbi:MAG: ribose transport system ATP-binding protein [Pseudonocardiales bacterium]|nr:ribose transport system ATP-binding protein [Pseudonocardiales bacterium]